MYPRVTIILFIIIVSGILWSQAMSDKTQVDMILHNGRIYVMDNDNKIVKAMAVLGDRIIAIGSDDEIVKSYDAKSSIDLKGRSVIPGLTDAHAHMLGLGMSMMMIDLSGARSADEVSGIVKSQVNKTGEMQWIQGYGWDHNKWSERELPHHSILDRAATGTPVYLTRIDMHAAWVNARALELSGITRNTPDPYGGRILRDADGFPTGILIDAAMSLVKVNIPEPSVNQKRDALERAVKKCLSYGITTVHDMGMDLTAIDIYKDLIHAGDISFRLYVTIEGTGDTWEHFLRHGRIVGHEKNMLTVRAIKLYADGTLGSRGAALIESYKDDPKNDGILLNTEEEIYNITIKALENGFQVCTHAIGDRANRMVLNAYEKALRRVPVHNHRLRIEHAQVVHPDDVMRFSEYGVIPSMQPIHCTSDMSWAVDRLGNDRAQGAYAWRRFLDQESIIAGGSDFPVEPVNPLLGVFAAVTRQNENFEPDGGWYPGQCVTRYEAFRMFTSWAAYAAFEDDIKGTLESGKLADFVIYPDDIMEIDAGALLTLRPDLTVLGGTIAYDKTSGG